MPAEHDGGIYLSLIGRLAAVIGPLLGGALSQWFGWRSCFIALAAFGGAIVLPLLVLVVPETHQWLVLQQMTQQQQSNIKEREEILSVPPLMQAPWVPLRWGQTSSSGCVKDCVGVCDLANMV